MDGWDRDLAHRTEMYACVLARTRELVVYAACTARKKHGDRKHAASAVNRPLLGFLICIFFKFLMFMTELYA